MPTGPATDGRRTEPVARRTGTSGRRRDRGRPAARRSRILPLALGGLAVLAAAILAIVLSQTSGTSPAGSGAIGSGSASAGAASAGPAGVTGEALPPFDAGAQDAAVGRPIPEASGSSFAGEPVAIARDGRPKLLLFLAHWCPHCQAEVPRIQGWVDQNGLPEGVDFVSVATSITSTRPNYPPDAWLTREGWTVPVLVDPDDGVGTAYGLMAFPYWVAVNGDGTVAWRRTGSIDVAELPSIFEDLGATAASPGPFAPAASPGASPG